MKPSYRITYHFLAATMFFLISAGICNAADAVNNTSEALRRVEKDTDGDGNIDRVALLDAFGNPSLLSADTDGDGRLDTFQYYEAGTVVRLEQDTDADGSIDGRDVFENGRRIRSEHLTSDGEIDGIQHFDENDLLVEWRRDTTGDGTLDTVCQYSEGSLEQVSMDTTGDGAFDIAQTYHGGILKQQCRDTDGDGVMDVTMDLVEGTPLGVSQDTDGDGTFDIWKTYEKGVLISTEEDRDRNGAVDARHTYDKAGQIVSSRLDDDGDGYFEVRVGFEENEWSRVEISDGEGRLLESRAYSQGVLRQRKLLDANSGLPVLLETYDENGRIIVSREEGGVPGMLDLAWYYDEQGEVERAESDRDADGNVDIWYYYQDGVAVRIEEDRDRDGKPDLWEDYGADETLLSRREDLDFDGTADIEEKF